MPFAAALLLSAIGCRPDEVDPPIVTLVDPPFAFNGEDTRLRVVGTGFWPEVQLSTAPERSPSPDLGKSFEAFLVGPDDAAERIPLDTTWVSPSELTVTVEAHTAAKGVYDVEVVTPRGTSGVGDQLLTVTDLLPTRLSLEAANSTLSVEEEAVVSIRLLGWDELLEEEVFVPLDMAVTATAGPDATIEWLDAPGALTQGQAVIKVRSDVAQTVHLTVTASVSASAIAEGVLDLFFVPGEEWKILIALDENAPEPPFVAGTDIPFTAQLVDQNDIPIVGSLSVTLRTNCGSWLRDISLESGLEKSFVVTPDQATSDEVCPEEYVRTVTPVPLPTSGESERFEVLPGPVDHFRVTASPTALQAGDVVTVLAEPEDAFGNRTGWGGDATLAATGGGLQAVECGAFDQLQLCTAQVTLATPSVVVEVVGEDGIRGSSNPITIVADDEPAVLLLTASGPATAGVPTEVEVRAQDAWGNPMDASVLGADAFALGDELGDVECSFSTFLGDGAAEFTCTFTVARGDAVLEAEVPAFAVAGTAAPIVVQNGALTTVTLTAPAGVTAGVVFTANVQGADAYGNPYLVQSDPIVDVFDDTGTFPLSQVTLGADGTGVAIGSLTLAGATVLRASQGGVELGVSGAIVVYAGPGATFGLRPAVPWAFVDEPLEIAIETFDAFGNAADWEGDVTLTSTATASPAVVVPLVDGVGAGTFTWATPVFEETLLAEADAISSSLGIVVVEDCATSGPAAVLLLDGFSEGIECLDPATDSATFTLDLSTSIAGAEPLLGYVVGRLGEPATALDVPVSDLTVAGVGPHHVGGLVMDAGRCGSETFATAWAGPDDGTPTGPIAFVPQDVQLFVFDNVAFDVLGVVDCARLPAAFANIGMRSTAGDLLGPVPTGAGLELTLDAAGNGVFTVDTNGALEDGVAEVHAFVPSGAARGALELPIVGDNVLPVVVDQDPSGPVNGSISEIRLVFSEPLSPSSVVAESFTVAGPSAVTVSAATLEASDTEVVLTLSPAADGAAGVWTVAADTSLLDLGANALAGAWGSGGVPYVGAFGDVGQLVDPVACVAIDPPALVFRPDGDPGADIESDEVSITLDAASAPAWWVLDVTDASGLLRMHDRIPPLGATDTIVWDGRGFDGMVVENGTFTVTVVPADGAGNRGSGCTLHVVIDNRIGAVP